MENIKLTLPKKNIDNYSYRLSTMLFNFVLEVIIRLQTKETKLVTKL